MESRKMQYVGFLLRAISGHIANCLVIVLLGFVVDYVVEAQFVDALRG